MKYLLVLVVVVAAVLACSARFTNLSDKEYEALFKSWATKNQKVYSSEEYHQRFTTFKVNAIFIQTHNANLNNSFTVAMNKFGDLSPSEFSRLYKGYNNVRRLSSASASDLSGYRTKVNPSIPASVDWRSKGAVTGIKNQGQCGSCWSFSTTGSTEGAHFLQAKKTLVGLSEQNLVDCSQAEGNEGCNGGLMDDAFKYIIVNNGIDTESSYPYEAVQGRCRFKRDDVAAKLVSYHDVPSGNEKALTTEVAERGPVSVAIDASHSSFQFYSGGVYYEPACSSTELDHGVLSVGYGEQSGKNYYIVKNSWGTDWGMAGYILMSRDRNNNCGIATAASFPCATSACKPDRV